MAHPFLAIRGAYPTSPSSYFSGPSSKFVNPCRKCGVWPTDERINLMGFESGGRGSRSRSMCIDNCSGKVYGRALSSVPIEQIQLWSRVHWNGHSQPSTKTRRSKTLRHKFPDSSILVLSQMRRRRSFPLMSHEPTTDPVFGSRLYDLLKTCIPETSVLDENTRKNRLRICLNCLWYFGRAYNQSGISQPLPSYFRNSLIPEVVRRVQTEEDSGVRVIGHCFEALIINMFVADINSRTNPISNGELVLLSTILNTGSHDVKLLLRQPGAIALANMISFISDKVGTLVADTIPSDVLDVVQQTLGILSQSQSLLAHESADSELQLDQPIAMIDVSKRNFEHILLSRLHDLLNTCIPATSPLPEEVHASCLQMCLKGLWYFARAFNRPENSMPLPPNIYITLSNPEMIRHIREQRNPTFRVIGCCVMGLVLSKLAADINSRTVPVSDVELASLSSILGSESRGVRVCLTQPGVVGLINMVSITLHPSFLKAKEVPLDARDVFQQTLEILYQALPAQENDELRPDQAIALSNISDNRFEHAIVSRLHSFLKTCIPGASPLTEEVRTSCLHLSLKALWHSAKAYHDTYNPLPPYFPIILASPEIAHHFQTERDPVARLTGCCLGALIVSKLVDALKSPFSLGGHVDNAELACISAILGKGHYGKLLWPRQILVINLQNIVSLMSREVDILFTTEGTPGDMLDIAQDTLYILASSLRRIGFEGVPMDQWGLLLGIPAEVLNIRVEVLNAVDSDLDRLKDQTMKRLDRLQQVLEKL
ncbi:hypothetical protein BJY52DRAFT_446694 [Lactarius psammicola]|nr:hypothetical protein BJY52DRAFT_446694 [Lactarius psammicola]